MRRGTGTILLLGVTPHYWLVPVPRWCVLAEEQRGAARRVCPGGRSVRGLLRGGRGSREQRVVIASEAWQSRQELLRLDCFGATALRNDGGYAA
jgi:hypothetical protein